MSSPTDNDDPAWGGGAMNSSEEDASASCEDDLEAEHEVEGNPDLDNSDGSSDGMVGKARRPVSG